LTFTIMLFGVILLINASPAYAYIDPNTGGFFFQTVAPFVYGILGVIVVFWKRIVTFCKGLFGRNKDRDESSKV
jgi:CBS domain containing-hemolysin-like protein